jgi:hypothetical protein
MYDTGPGLGLESHSSSCFAGLGLTSSRLGLEGWGLEYISAYM